MSSGLLGAISAQCDVPFMKTEINPSGRSFRTLRACQGSIVPGGNGIKMVFLAFEETLQPFPFEGLVVRHVTSGLCSHNQFVPSASSNLRSLNGTDSHLQPSSISQAAFKINTYLAPASITEARGRGTSISVGLETLNWKLNFSHEDFQNAFNLP